MAYARFDKNSDVYVFLDTYGFLHCCGCSIGGYRFYKTSDMLRHLNEHIEAGHRVPNGAIKKLKADGSDNDAWIKRQLKHKKP